tara:strand:- start:194 stop:355 length:162 start_codon:yes stop_codon:yes gene_type:complete
MPVHTKDGLTTLLNKQKQMATSYEPLRRSAPNKKKRLKTKKSIKTIQILKKLQ